MKERMVFDTLLNLCKERWVVGWFCLTLLSSPRSNSIPTSIDHHVELHLGRFDPFGKGMVERSESKEKG